MGPIDCQLMLKAFLYLLVSSNWSRKQNLLSLLNNLFLTKKNVQLMDIFQTTH